MLISRNGIAQELAGELDDDHVLAGRQALHSLAEQPPR